MTEDPLPSPDADRAALDAVLPADLARREAVIEGAARHLALVREANLTLNLTRILDPEEAAVKHVLDSLLGLPYLEDAQRVLDLGSGPGFPGIPLALAREDLQVELVESVKKKAAALEGFVDALGLGPRVRVHPVRAEDHLREHRVDVVVARAAGKTVNLLRFLVPVRGRFRRIVLYKGPGAAAEHEEARLEAHRLKMKATLYEGITLPGDHGTRTFLVYDA